MKRRIFLELFTAGTVMTASTNLFANELIDLYENSVSKKPYVEFVAREGIPGHAFVVLGVELDNGLTFDLGVYGFYPKDGKTNMIKALFSTDGEITYKWADLERDVAFRREITAEQQQAVHGLFEMWKDSKYSLLGKQCSVFASEVATAAGLKKAAANPSLNLPVIYMKALKDANP